MARRGKALCSVVVLGLGFVVLSPVTEVLFAHTMSRMDFEPTPFSNQRQVFPDPYAAVVKQYVVVAPL